MSSPVGAIRGAADQAGLHIRAPVVAAAIAPACRGEQPLSLDHYIVQISS
jgi:hypothetical protein